MIFVFCTLITMVVSTGASRATTEVMDASTSHNRRFSEPEAARVASSVIDQLIRLQSRGMYHNDVRVGTLEFVGDDAILAKPTNPTTVSERIPIFDHARRELGIAGAERHLYFESRGKAGDQKYVQNVLGTFESDTPCLELVKPEEVWRTNVSLDRVIARSARIFCRYVPGWLGHTFNVTLGHFASNLSITDVLEDLYTDVVSPRVFGMDKDFFMHFMTEVDHDRDRESFVNRYMGFDSRIVRIILAIRELARYITVDRRPRREFASVILLFLELQGATETQPFWDLMQSPRTAISELTDFYSVPLSDKNRDALYMAWDVMHGLEPNYGQLKSLLSRHPETVTV